jgi:hypothetical protein
MFEVSEAALRIFQAAGISFSILFGIVAAGKGLQEYSKANKIHEEELKWKKTLLVKDLWSAHRTGKTRDAMTMLDWDGRKYEVRSNDFQQVSWSAMLLALRTQSADERPLHFSTAEVYIRDCFDELFDDYGKFELYIESHLLDPESLRNFCGYYIKKIIEHDNRHYAEYGTRPIENFMTYYGYRKALDFCARRSSWRNRKDAIGIA